MGPPVTASFPSHANLSLTVNVVPFPGVESTSIVPWCSLRTWQTMGNPSPVPSSVSALAASDR